MWHFTKKAKKTSWQKRNAETALINAPIGMYKSAASSLTCALIDLPGLLAVGLHQELVHAVHPGDIHIAGNNFTMFTILVWSALTSPPPSSCKSLLGLGGVFSPLASQRRPPACPWPWHSPSWASRRCQWSSPCYISYITHLVIAASNLLVIGIGLRIRPAPQHRGPDIIAHTLWQQVYQL